MNTEQRRGVSDMSTPILNSIPGTERVPTSRESAK